MKNASMPAMPVTDEAGMPFVGTPDDICTIGLTKREYFAGLALQGLCSDPDMRDAETEAALAVRLADALLKELESTQP